jgi:YbbR domain-containing protein
MRLFNSILNIVRFNRRNWKAVVLCIFAATVFWFFNALNKSYTTNINFPLTFDYDKDNYVPVRNLPAQVRLNVTGNGWDLFKRSTGVKVVPLEIPLERPADVKRIVGNSLQPFFSSQVEGMQLNFVLTDTLFVDLEPKAGRWIELTMDSIQFNLKRGYGLISDVDIEPDSIYVEGPRPVINRIKEPFKIRLHQRNIDESFSEDVEIDLPQSDVIRRDPPTVSVKFRVDRMINLIDSVKLTAENIPPTVSYIEDAWISVTFDVTEGTNMRAALQDVRAVMDLKNFKRGSARVLPRVTGLPPFTRVVKIDSVNIKL